MDKEQLYSIIGKDVVSNATNEASTPCYVYFKQVVHKRVKELRECLPSSFRIHYAVKANPNRVLLQELSSLGIGADVTSLGELNTAIACGIKAAHIEFSGPGKSKKEICEAMRLGVSSINAESLSELEEIARISRQVGVRASVGLRINPGQAVHKAGMTMSGDTQFGISLHLVAEALELIKRQPEAISFTGIHVHSGSQILSSDAVIDNFRTILELSLQIADLDILPIRKINFGGGLGIRYFSHQRNLNLTEVASGLKELFRDVRYASLLHIQHIVEPGRFLVGECGLYVTRVRYRQPRLEKEFLIVDGGMHQNYLLAGGMGQVVRRNFEIDVISVKTKQNGTTPAVYDIAGCLCTTQDLLATNFHSDREIDIGDRIVFFNSGAYGLTASPINFLGHNLPAEIFV